jgi:hypothetical protein
MSSEEEDEESMYRGLYNGCHISLLSTQCHSPSEGVEARF